MTTDRRPFCGYVTGHHGFSVQRQTEVIKAYASRKGWPAPLMFVDEITGSSKAFDALVQHCAENPAATVIVERAGRVARNVDKWQRLATTLATNKGCLHSVADGGIVPARLIPQRTINDKL